jgi:tetratricopeptide (TPR) repeat protein
MRILKQFSIFSVLIALTGIPCLCESAEPEPDNYNKDIVGIVENFDQIQAAMEVAFDGSLYIGSIQKLNFEHKKFQEAYKNKKERRYLSFTLESSIVNTYMGLVAKVKENSGKLTQDEVNRVIDDNQRKISFLRTAITVEKEEGAKGAWLRAINSQKEAGDFISAQEYTKLAIEAYGDEEEFRAVQKEVEDYIGKLTQDAENAGKLMEEKKYRDALIVLKNLIKVRADDTEIAKMYETALSYVDKMDKLVADAKKYEEENRFKEAFRTWENLLEYDPENKEAKGKIEEYQKQLKLSTTEILTTCESCSGQGYCNVCKGSGLCIVCNGYRKCIKCRGAGFFSRSCPTCLCPECRGNGTCSTCSGYGTITCNSCGGNGFHRMPKTVVCNVCKGTGKSRFRDAPCTACGGTGNTVVNVDTICTVCNGAKVLPCNICGGTGKCKTCFGRGHTPGCGQCGGTGILTAPCTFCSRTGNCPECVGNGVCKYCKGSGKCAECNGPGVIIKKMDEGKYLDEKNHYISATTNPRGAQIFLDGKLSGVTPLEIENVEQGKHQIKISKQGYEDFNYQTVFAENSAVKLDIRLINKYAKMYRVVGISKDKHVLLFRHYQEQEKGSFMISLYIDGANEWKVLGDKVFGYTISELKRESKTNYNPRLKEMQVVDYSSLILKKADGTEVAVPMGNSVNLIIYKAKIYDNAARQLVYVGEGTELGGFTVQSISDNEVVLREKSGNTFTISRQ